MTPASRAIWPSSRDRILLMLIRFSLRWAHNEECSITTCCSVDSKRVAIWDVQRGYPSQSLTILSTAHKYLERRLIMPGSKIHILGIGVLAVSGLTVALWSAQAQSAKKSKDSSAAKPHYNELIQLNAERLLKEGKQ